MTMLSRAARILYSSTAHRVRLYIAKHKWISIHDLGLYNIVFAASYDSIFAPLMRALMDWRKLTSTPADNIATLQTSTSVPSESHCDAPAPSYSMEELSVPLAPPDANLGMPSSSVALPLPNNRRTDPVAVPGLPVGASAGPVTEHERSSLETSTSIYQALKVNTMKRQRTAKDITDASSSPKRSKKHCKAGNAKCGLETGRSILSGDVECLACDVCCTEPGFCRECKCILCCKTIIPEGGQSNFVRCLCKPSGEGMCGHAAHLECALHSKMAGVVRNRDLDMEYLCRRCDNRTDLIELVTLLIEAVDTTALRTHAVKNLELALEIMKGTARARSGAKVLDSLVQTALRKVRAGTDVKEVFKELKDQGAAAEAARQGNVGRGSTLIEDVSQQPEASLDQWLPSSGSPSSNPSPGTLSSFTSAGLKSNPSVTSGQLSGTQAVDGSLGKHREAKCRTDNCGEPQISHEDSSYSKYKNSHLRNKALIRNGGQLTGSRRICAVSSNDNNIGPETVCDSVTSRTPGNHVAEPGSFDGNSPPLRTNLDSNFGSKILIDLRNASSEVGTLPEDIFVTGMCKSCGTVRHHSNNAVVISSSVKSSKIENGGNEVLTSPLTPRDEERGDLDGHKHVAESDTGADGSDRPRSTYSANGYVPIARSCSLQLLDLQCEQDMQAALQKLRRSQEAEFERAKACLTAKKESIMRKYELFETTRREFSEQPVLLSLDAFDELLLRTGNQFAGAIQERDNFKIMLKIGEGFGSVSNDTLKKFYRWPAK